MGIRLLLKGCRNAAKIVCGQIILTMTMSLSMASERTDGLLPENQRLFFTPAQRASSSVGEDVDFIPERVLERALDKQNNVTASVKKPIVTGRANSTRKSKAYPDIHYEGLVSSGSSYHVLINNVPCQTGKSGQSASVAPLAPVLMVNCPHGGDFPYRLSLQMNELKLLVHLNGRLLGQLEVGQQL